RSRHCCCSASTASENRMLPSSACWTLMKRRYCPSWRTCSRRRSELCVVSFIATSPCLVIRHPSETRRAELIHWPTYLPDGKYTPPSGYSVADSPLESI